MMDMEWLEAGRAPRISGWKRSTLHKAGVSFSRYPDGTREGRVALGGGTPGLTFGNFARPEFLSSCGLSFMILRAQGGAAGGVVAAARGRDVTTVAGGGRSADGLERAGYSAHMN
jgi:hypothetical protein